MPRRYAISMPVVLSEFASGPDKFLAQCNLRDRKEITIIIPSDDVLPFKPVSDFIRNGFSEKKINFIPQFKDSVIDGKTKEISSGI